MNTPSTRSTEVVSTGGVPLAAQVAGHGPPLVLVHGTGATRDDWGHLPQLLAAEHTVWWYDRRGRGGSGDAPAYDIERDVDDIRSVLSAAGEPAHLLGHSFGAVCALKAAASGAALRSLVIYEPPIHVKRVSDSVERAIAQLGAGDRDGAVTTFLLEVAGVPPDDLQAFRSVPQMWDPTVALAETICREIRALADLDWDPTDFRSISAPAMHIAGELTEGLVYPTAQDISDALPHASQVTIAGQDHVAFALDPEGFAEVVLSFTRRHDMSETTPTP